MGKEKVYHLLGYRSSIGWMNIGIYHSKYSMLNYAKHHLFERYAYIVYDKFLYQDPDYPPCPNVFSSDCKFLEVRK